MAEISLNLPAGLTGEAVRAHLAGRGDAAPDPVDGRVWWLSGDAGYLAAAIARRRSGREPYAAKVTLAGGSVVLDLDCIDSCVPALRSFAGWLLEAGAVDAAGRPASLAAIFA